MEQRQLSSTLVVLLILGFHKTGLSSSSSWSLADRSGAGVGGGFGTGGGASFIGPNVMKPYLEPIKYNTTVFVGQSAYLPCVVKHLGDKTVSWIRQRDLHILTSGGHVYTSDHRFSILREGKLLNAWTLKISSVQRRDEGVYECQVNTEPKLTATLYLLVLGSVGRDPDGSLSIGMLDAINHQRDDFDRKGYTAKILGSSVVQVPGGEVANLTCLIAHRDTPPNVTWFMNDIPIQKSRGGLNIETEKSPFKTQSSLVIIRVGKGDEGKYSCGGVTVYPSSVVLKVIPPSDPLQKPWKELPLASSNSKDPSLSASASLSYFILQVLILIYLYLGGFQILVDSIAF